MLGCRDKTHRPEVEREFQSFRELFCAGWFIKHVVRPQKVESCGGEFVCSFDLIIGLLLLNF